MRIPLICCFLMFSGCFPYDGPDAGKDTHVQDTSSAPDVPQLIDTHPGWQNPMCLNCHTPDAHNKGLDPYQCAACHDTNGAPSGHGGTTPCSACHGEPHGSTGFPDPEACQTCHPG